MTANLESCNCRFQDLIDGKPLISEMHGQVDFRLVVNQRVFEATFYVNGSDVLDGSEKILYLPSAFLQQQNRWRSNVGSISSKSREGQTGNVPPSRCIPVLR